MRIESLTFLRFVAAMIVVVFHYGRKATGLTGFLVSGPQMVTFFFVLSGFVMALAYGGKPKVRFLPYLWARAARILPIYWLALALVVILLLVRGLSSGLDPLTLGLNVTLLQVWVPRIIGLNHPGWSLSVEWFFYVSFPWLLLLCRWGLRRPRWLVAGSLLFWALTQYFLSRKLESLGGNHSAVVDYSPYAHYCSFVLGLVGGLIFKRRRWAHSSGLGAFLGAFISGALIVFCLDHPDAIEAAAGRRLAFRSSFYSPLFLVFLLSVAASRWRWSEYLSWRPLVFMGEASYSLYILQLPIYQMYVMYLKPHLQVGALTHFCSYVTILLGISCLTYRFFEKPANAYLRRQRPFFFMGGKRTDRG